MSSRRRRGFKAAVFGEAQDPIPSPLHQARQKDDQVALARHGEPTVDSLGVEEDGNICVATIGQSGISVISPEGQLVDFVSTDDPFTTNICWGGEDRKTAYVTLSGTGRLMRMPWPRAGLRLAG